MVTHYVITCTIILCCVPLARSLEQQHSVRMEGEVASLHQQLRRLQEKLQQQMTHEKNLREENDQLRRCVCVGGGVATAIDCLLSHL